MRQTDTQALAAIREACRRDGFWQRLDTATKTESEVVRRVRALLEEHDDQNVLPQFDRNRRVTQ